MKASLSKFNNPLLRLGIVLITYAVTALIFFFFGYNYTFRWLHATKLFFVPMAISALFVLLKKYWISASFYFGCFAGCMVSTIIYDSTRMEFPAKIVWFAMCFALVPVIGIVWEFRKQGRELVIHSAMIAAITFAYILLYLVYYHFIRGPYGMTGMFGYIATEFLLFVPVLVSFMLAIAKRYRAAVVFFAGTLFCLAFGELFGKTITYSNGNTTFIWSGQMVWAITIYIVCPVLAVLSEVIYEIVIRKKSKAS